MPGFLHIAAIDVIRQAHKNQKRKYTGEPYIVHPFAVAGLVSSVTNNDEMILAAYLHDTVEDTDITFELIQGIFGKEVRDLVFWLTDASKPEDGNRAERKKIDRLHIAAAPAAAKTIKLADLIDNTKSITAYDPVFAKVYMAEKKLLLEVLKDGDSELYGIAENLVRKYYEEK